jgi:hypothetical protein
MAVVCRDQFHGNGNRSFDLGGSLVGEKTGYGLGNPAVSFDGWSVVGIGSGFFQCHLHPESIVKGMNPHGYREDHSEASGIPHNRTPHSVIDHLVYDSAPTYCCWRFPGFMCKFVQCLKFVVENETGKGKCRLLKTRKISGSWNHSSLSHGCPRYHNCCEISGMD